MILEALSAIVDGQMQLDARMRYNRVQEIGYQVTDLNTLATNIKYTSKVFLGNTFLLGFNNNSPIIINNMTPLRTKIYEPSKTKTTIFAISNKFMLSNIIVGRQIDELNEGVLLGINSYKQTPQYYDGIKFTKRTNNQSFNYFYIKEFYQNYRRDYHSLKSNSHYFNYEMTIKNISISPFYFIDNYDDVKNIGLSFSYKFETKYFNEEFWSKIKLKYIKQNSTKMIVSNLHFDIDDLDFIIGYNRKEDNFKNTHSSRNNFFGRSEKFNNVNFGISELYPEVKIKHQNLSLALSYHNLYPIRKNFRKFGHEWDLIVGYKFNKLFGSEFVYSSFRACKDSGMSHFRKVSLQLTVKTF